MTRRALISYNSICESCPLAGLPDMVKGWYTVQNTPEKLPSDLMAEPEDELEIDLMHLLCRLLDQWKLILAAGLVMALLAAGYAGLRDRNASGPADAAVLYTAVSKLYVSVPDALDQENGLEYLKSSSYLTADCREIAQGRDVREKVQSRLAETYGEGADFTDSTVTVSSPSDSRIIYISIETDDAALATAMANAYAEEAAASIPQLIPGVQVTVFEYAETLEELPADVINGISRSRLVKFGILGLALGAFLMGAALLVRCAFDNAVYTGERVETELALPVLGKVPMTGADRAERTGKGRESK